MQTPVSNSEVEDTLRQLLTDEGYQLTDKRVHGETGVDIIAEKSSETYHIEAIGYKKVGAVRAKDFFEGFFPAVSRLNQGATHCILAVSHHAETGLPTRAQQHQQAWLRIAQAFPELEIWLIDTGKIAYRRTTWREWAERRS